MHLVQEFSSNDNNKNNNNNKLDKNSKTNDKNSMIKKRNSFALSHNKKRFHAEDEMIVNWMNSNYGLMQMLLWKAWALRSRECPTCIQNAMWKTISYHDIRHMRATMCDLLYKYFTFKSILLYCLNHYAVDQKSNCFVPSDSIIKSIN